MAIPVDAPAPMSVRERAAIALLIGGGAAALALVAMMAHPQFGARDFTYQWRAAHALIEGLDPYRVIRPTGPYPYENYYYYPVPAALTAMPFVMLSPIAGAALFVGLSSAALAYALTAQGRSPLVLFLTPAYLVSAVLGQMTPLLLAGALLPALQWSFAGKPTIAAALAVARPSRLGLACAAALVAATLVLWPTWPAGWLDAIRHTPHHRAAVLRPLGFVALAGLLRWRRPEGRLLAALACVPQVFFFYDQLPLQLVARTARQGLTLAALGWIAWGIGWGTCVHRPMCVESSEPWIIPLLYLPALALVLRRPNEGPVARWADRLGRSLRGLLSASVSSLPSGIGR